MRRSIIIIGLATSLAAVALIYSTISHNSPQISYSAYSEEGQATESSPVIHADDQIAIDPQRSLTSDSESADTEFQSSSYDAPPPGFADEETTAKWIREEAMREVPKLYSILLDRLDLTPAEQEALLELLIGDYIASTRTRYSSGEGMDEHERLDKLDNIIGDAKLQQFLAMEQNLGQHGEVLHMQDVFQKYEVPMTDVQKSRMLGILIEVQNRDLAVPGANSERGTIEYLEHQIAKIDERSRLVFEQAGSVLSTEQIEYLFEWYQRDSYRRAEALERQKKAIAQGDNSLPLHYPGRTNPEEEQ